MFILLINCGCYPVNIKGNDTLDGRGWAVGVGRHMTQGRQTSRRPVETFVYYLWNEARSLAVGDEVAFPATASITLESDNMVIEDVAPAQ